MTGPGRYNDHELLTQFRDACLAQYDTYINGETRKYNKLNDFLPVVTRELMRRDVEHRRLLLTLSADRNPQVRLKAANFVYSVAAVEARACLESIAAAGLPEQSLSAGMTMNRLEEAPNCLDWIWQRTRTGFRSAGRGRGGVDRFIRRRGPHPKVEALGAKCLAPRENVSFGG